MSSRPNRAPFVREPPGVYRPRRPEATVFYRLVDDHYAEFALVHDDQFAREDGPLRPVVGRVVEQFLDCGRLTSGFARVRCPKCKAEYGSFSGLDSRAASCWAREDPAPGFTGSSGG